MLASQVIAQLNELMAAHGDQNVTMENAYDSQEITDIQIDKLGESPYFILYSNSADPGVVEE